MKKKIALCGVFDLSNYGDHLFPIAFNLEMKKRDIEIDLFLFSVFKGVQGFDENKDVYSIDELESMHLKVNFDAIVVGGGEIILFGIMKQKFEFGEEEYVDYNISKIWTTASLVSNKHNINLIWNVPGIPFMFDDELKKIVKSLINNVDYLSVRNDFSKKVLLNCGFENDDIYVYPDTGIKVHDYYNREELKSVRESLIGFNKKYIVYHANRFITENDKIIVIETLEYYRSKGYEIVLLPLAYTHGDEIICSELNKLSNNNFVHFERKLSMIEIVSILSGCELYVGVSFHGAITSVSFGKKAIAFDFMHNNKTRDLFNMFDLKDYYIVDPTQLRNKIQECINENRYVDLREVENNINEHFDNIKYSICNYKNKAKTLTEFAIQFNTLIESKEFERKNTANYLDSLKISIEHYKITHEDIRNYVIELEKSVDHYKNVHEDVRNYAIELEKSVEYYNMEERKTKECINRLEEQVSFLTKETVDTKNEIRIKNELICDLKLYINRIENSIAWKILNFFKIKY